MNNSQRQILGDELVIWCQCRDANGVPVAPDAAPYFYIYDSSNALVKSERMPPVNRYGQIGVFRYMKHLGPLFPVGRYTIFKDYLVSTVLMEEEPDFLEILPSGNKNGRIITLNFFHQPQADHLLMHSDRGLILQGRNPRISTP